MSLKVWKAAALSTALALGTVAAHAWPTLMNEGFDNVAGLVGWSQQNLSSPVGSTGWFQGDSGVFPAQSGAPSSYIAANFNNADTGGNIQNWLITPTLSFADNGFLSFFTQHANNGFADRLQVRLSTSGSSTNTADFSTLLLTINEVLDPTGYPDAWTEFTVGLSALGAGVSGRLAFVYDVPDTNVNGDYIGIDSVVVQVPEPATVALVALSLAALVSTRRRKQD